MQELQHMALNPLHLEHRAKMVPFAGFEMPVHYQHGIIHEHHHTRNHAGLFDISHMGQLFISGDKAAAELETLTPSDITGLQTGQQRYTVFTNENGGIIDDLIITRLATGLLLIVNASRKQQDLKHLQAHLSSACRLEELNDSCLLALQGPEAAVIMQKLAPAAVELFFMNACETTIEDIPCIISRSGYTGEDGFEISVAKLHAEQLARLFLQQDNVELIGLGARDTLRLEAGLCLYGHELNESITPVEAGLTWTFRTQPDDFLGAGKILQQRFDGPTIKRVGFRVEEKAPVREGTEIITAENSNAGYITSGGFSPSVGTPVAMGYVQTGQIATDGPLFARVRKRNIPVSISPLPFIAHRYYHKKP